MRIHVYDTDSGALLTGERCLLERWREQPGLRLWLDAEALSEDECAEVLEGLLGLHPLAVQDAMRKRHPPKLERFGDRLFLLLRGLDVQTTGLDFGVLQLAMFVGPRFLVTRRTKQSLNTDALWQEVAAKPELLADPGALALTLSGRVIRRYVSLLIGIEPRLEELEEEIFDRPNDALLQELSRLKSRLTQLRRVFVYHELVFRDLRGAGSAALDDSLHRHVVDIHEQADRAVSLAELYYSLVDDLQNACIAAASHRLNKVMQVLTIFTVIFVPLSFLAGVYGMNFEYMPELKSHGGYYILLGVMLTIVVVQLAVFRMRRWI